MDIVDKIKDEISIEEVVLQLGLPLKKNGNTIVLSPEPATLCKFNL